MYYGEKRWASDAKKLREVYDAHASDPRVGAVSFFRWTVNRWAEWRKGAGKIYEYMTDEANDAFNAWLEEHPA